MKLDKDQVSIEDLGILSFLIQNPVLDDAQRRQYLEQIQDHQQREIAAVLMNLKSPNAVTADVQEALVIIAAWRKRYGIPLQSRCEPGDIMQHVEIRPKKRIGQR